MLVILGAGWLSRVAVKEAKSFNAKSFNSVWFCHMILHKI
jgi:hypothetical protein